MVRSQWEPFAAAVAKIGLPVRRLVLTHAHIDHVGGSRAFANASVLGSQQTSDLLDGEMPLAAYKAFMPAFDAEFDGAWRADFEHVAFDLFAEVAQDVEVARPGEEVLLPTFRFLQLTAPNHTNPPT